MIYELEGKRLEMTSEEYSYYKDLLKTFGKDACKNSFSSDDSGKILSVAPSLTEPMPIAILFFLLNLMMNQRLRALDSKVTKIEDFENKIIDLEKKINHLFDDFNRTNEND